MDKSAKPARRQPKAYQDTRFLESKDARALRILAEYLEPLYRFQRNNVRDTIVFMGSARLRSEEAAKAALAEAEQAGQGVEAAQIALQLSVYYEAARELAQRLTAWSKRLDRDERRHFARKLVVDRIFVAADAVGRGIGRHNRGKRLCQCVEIAGVLQPAVPHPPPRPAQSPDRCLVGLRHAVDIGGNLDADRPAVTRLVAGNFDPKGLVCHRPSLRSARAPVQECPGRFR